MAELKVAEKQTELMWSSDKPEAAKVLTVPGKLPNLEQQFRNKFDELMVNRCAAMNRAAKALEAGTALYEKAADAKEADNRNLEKQLQEAGLL